MVLTAAVTELWIDKKLKVRELNWQKWKLEDWNEKHWKLKGQFCIFTKKKMYFPKKKIKKKRVTEQLRVFEFKKKQKTK